VSVERVERRDGSVVWRVRWRQGGRNRSKVLGRKRDAEAFDAELVRRKRTGELAQLDAGHSPKMGLDTYAHVSEEFDPAERVNAADRIRKARDELRFRAQRPGPTRRAASTPRLTTGRGQHLDQQRPDRLPVIGLRPVLAGPEGIGQRQAANGADRDGRCVAGLTTQRRHGIV
jgi:hypothetical protein